MFTKEIAMKSPKTIITLVLALALTACGTTTATPEATPMPIVEADDTIIAEGKLEPVSYTHLCYSLHYEY